MEDFDGKIPPPAGPAGAPGPGVAGMQDAIDEHAKALFQTAVDARTGQIKINIAQIYFDIELMSVKFGILVEMLSKRGLLDAEELATTLRDRLLAEATMLRAAAAEDSAPQIEIHRGRVPRNDG